MTENEPFVPDHIKAKEHAAAARKRRGPVPNDIRVTLPMDQQADAVDFRYGTFRPESIEWRAYVHKGELSVFADAQAGVALDGTYRWHGNTDSEPWCPPAPAWFDEQVARMRRVAEHDKWMAKRADHKAEASMGQL